MAVYYDFYQDEKKNSLQNLLLVVLTIIVSLTLIIVMRNYCTPQPFEDGILIDVQKESTYKQSHIPGSINIPYGNLNKQIKDMYPNLDTHINIYSRTASNTNSACEKLQKLGYKNIRNLGSIERAKKLLLDKALSSI